MEDRREENRPHPAHPEPEDKDTSEESQYDEQSGEDHPGPKDQPAPERPDSE